TSVIVPWLRENYGCKVVAFVADVGQGAEELEGVEAKAKASGASECHIVDLKDEFAADYIYPSLKTGAVYEQSYLLGTAMARPVIAKAQVELARKVNADALAHGCTGKGNDQIRFESCYAALAPELTVIAPWREWDLSSRESLLAYLAERNIPCSASLKKIYSRDANAWHISHEGGELEDPWCEPSDEVWTLTCSPEQAPDEPEYISLAIEQGAVVSVNGEALSPLKCLEQLNKLGAKHGIGRVDIVENRLVGMKSRGCYETPGGTIMMHALRGIDELVLDKMTRSWKTQLSEQFAQLLYDGRWFTPNQASVLAAAESLNQVATGEVVIKLYKGNVTVTQKCSPYSLYSEAFATFGADNVYDQKHAAGFIRLYSLSSRIRALKQAAKV
ncbi:argininosuccinate synthase, partial [Idiomarina sp.]